MFCKHFVQTVQTARLSNNKNFYILTEAIISFDTGFFQS